MCLYLLVCQEFEIYLHDKDNFVIVNVPPNFMFQAKVLHLAASFGGSSWFSNCHHF
jgi:hypothetical protein